MMPFYAQLLPLFFTFVEIHSASQIRMQRDFYYPTIENFPVYWNVPTFMCHKHGINFHEHTRKYGIIANHGDQFRGDDVNILYDPGLFPAMLQSTARSKGIERNGGIPQLGNLTRHLDSFKNVVEKLIPKNFAGIGIIDFEAWRPIFRQNWNAQAVYKDMSRDLERQKHPQWRESEVEAQAKKNFEKSSKVFMETTLKLAKLLRPKAKWGYYAFPYCFNYRSHGNMEPWCPNDVEKENNKIQWLFDESTAIYPSLYMSKVLNTEDHRKFVIGRLNEAWRVASRVCTTKIPEVHPYLWYKYYDSSDFLPETDLYNAFETTRKYKMGGMVIWGATNDVTSEAKCQKLLTYLKDVLGPTVVRVKRNTHKRVEEPQYEFVPLVWKPFNTSSPQKLNYNYSYQTVSSRPARSSTTSATPILSNISAWYERVLRAMFNT